MRRSTTTTPPLEFHPASRPGRRLSEPPRFVPAGRPGSLRVERAHGAARSECPSPDSSSKRQNRELELRSRAETRLECTGLWCGQGSLVSAAEPSAATPRTPPGPSTPVLPKRRRDPRPLTCPQISCHCITQGSCPLTRSRVTRVLRLLHICTKLRRTAFRCLSSSVQPTLSHLVAVAFVLLHATDYLDLVPAHIARSARTTLVISLLVLMVVSWEAYSELDSSFFRWRLGSP